MTSRQRAFTLIELLVVFAIIATLLSLVAPRYFKSVDRSKEVALNEILMTVRSTLDKYHEDTGKYPNSLDELVTRKYLRKVPVDPITGSDSTWIVISPSDAKRGGIHDVKSGASGSSLSGKPYNEF